jgi:Toxin SymE, type I toxin-antitoxin system
MAHAQTTPAPTPAQNAISRDSTQILAQGQEVRRLTVSYGARSVREPNGSSALAPMLRLQGAWLERAGFAIGVPVTVRVSAGRLVIEAAKPERVPQAEVLATITAVADGGLPKHELVELVRRPKRRRAD